MLIYNVYNVHSRIRNREQYLFFRDFIIVNVSSQIEVLLKVNIT